MAEVVILYILNKYDATIYRIMKLIDELFFAFIKTSAGTINPAIKRLENLGCIQCVEKMTDGGMLSKIYSITSAGKKHLTELLLNFSSSNPSRILNEAKIAIFCSNVLSVSEFIEFKENMLNNLELHKIKLEKGLQNQYIELSEVQKNISKMTVNEINELIKIL